MKYADQFEQYTSGVLSGEYPSGSLVKLAVRRHMLDLEIGHERGLSWSQPHADHACSFFPEIRHSTGEFAGTPFDLRLFQVFIVSSIFGWLRWDEVKQKWYRRFREAFITLAKGNGKSPIVAGIANYALFRDGEERAEGYCYATKRDQAKQLFDEACRQIRSCPALATQTVQYKLNLNGPLDSFFRPMGSETHDDGLVPHFMAMDEIHRWQEHHRPMYDVLTASLAKRPQPLLVKISTAGDENSHILKEELAAAERVLQQVDLQPDEYHGDEQFCYIACLDEDDDIHDPGNWPKANPMLLEPDGPVQVKALMAMSAKAKTDLAAELKFRRFHCNQQVSSLNKPIRAEVWAKGNRAIPSDYAEHDCYGGFDLARSNDFAAVSLVWPHGGDYVVKSWAWTVAERTEKLQTAEFLKLLTLPNLIVHEGDEIEFADIRKKIAELNETYHVAQWSFDPNWATETSQILYNDHGINAVPQPQTVAAYNEPIDRFLKAVNTHKVIHGGCDLLSWCAGNLVVATNSEGLKRPSKDKSVNKIDPIVALLMAWRGMMFGSDTPEPQVY